MKKIIFFCILMVLISINHNVLALTADHNLSRFYSSNDYEKNSVIKEMLDKAYGHEILLVPYSTTADKNDAINQLKKCVDHLSEKFPGQSIGTAMKVCCDKMNYLDM